MLALDRLEDGVAGSPEVGRLLRHQDPFPRGQPLTPLSEVLEAVREFPDGHAQPRLFASGRPQMPFDLWLRVGGVDPQVDLIQGYECQ